MYTTKENQYTSLLFEKYNIFIYFIRMGKPTLPNCSNIVSGGKSKLFSVKRMNSLTDTGVLTRNRMYASRLSPCYLSYKDRIKYGYNNRP